MAQEKINEVVGESFEDLKIDEMSETQGAGDVDAAGDAAFIRQRELALRVVQRRLRPFRIRIQRIVPHADFGNQDAVLLRGLQVRLPLRGQYDLRVVH